MKKNILTVLLIIETAILIFGVITRPAKGSEDIGQPTAYYILPFKTLDD